MNEPPHVQYMNGIYFYRPRYGAKKEGKQLDLFSGTSRGDTDDPSMNQIASHILGTLSEHADLGLQRYGHRVLSNYLKAASSF